MAIKINGTQVVDDSRNFTNIESVNGVSVAPAKPAITSPTDGFQTLDSSITFQSTAFEGAVVSDDHASSDWELATDSGFTNIVASSIDDTSNLTSITFSGLSVDTYFVRVRHSGATLGDSEYSDVVSFDVSTTVAYGWGSGGDYVFAPGVNDQSNNSSPIIVASSFTGWNKLAPGQDHVHALLDGTLYGWGSGDLGRLGTNNTSTFSNPVTVVGGITDWTDVDATQNVSYGIRQNGELYAWGYNYYGQLGIGTSFNDGVSSPVTVVGGITDWQTVQSSFESVAALRENGTIYAWGRNEQGEVGDNSTTQRNSPVVVAGGITDWKKLSAGFFEIFALRSNGVIYGWGNNFFGQLGDGTTTNRSSPVTVVGGITDWTDISAGTNACYAIRPNGEIYSWGDNAEGKLGQNIATFNDKSSPSIIAGGITDWQNVYGGRNSAAFAIRSNGVLYAWGSNSFGKLGDGTSTNRSSPVTVVGGITDWTDIYLGPNSSSFGLVAQ